jgi:hypothetical protein
MSNDQPSDIGAFVAGLGLTWVIIVLVVWLVYAIVAGLVAPEQRTMTFFWLTLPDPRSTGSLSRLHRAAQRPAV